MDAVEAPKWQQTYEARTAICKAIDALGPAWSRLKSKEAARLQRLVEQLEGLRNDVEARSDKERRECKS